MKKKVLAALMAMLMVIGVVGCGSDSGTSASSIPPETRPTESSSVTVEEVPEEDEMSENDEEGEIYDTEKSENDNTGTGKDDISAESTTEPTSSGITVCVQSNAGLGMDYALFLINPETNSCEELNCFSYRNTDEGYCFPALQIYDSNYRTLFSQDASKMAVTYTIRSTKGKRAGWLDGSGNFFDVPEALGMKPENEFVVQPDYYSIGFTTDGEYFVFAEVTGGNHSDSPKIEQDGKFYYVSLNDMSLSEGNPIADEARRGYDVYAMNGLTDWISDSEFLSDHSQNFVIRDANGVAENIEPVPGDSRYNRSAVVSPNGLIAFVSSPKTTSEDTAIYTTTRDGSDIQRIFDCSVFNASDGKFPNKLIWIYLVRWR